MTNSIVKKLVEMTGMEMYTVDGQAARHSRDHVRNDTISERLKVANITEKCRNAILGWFGHEKRRDQR